MLPRYWIGREDSHRALPKRCAVSPATMTPTAHSTGHSAR